MVTGQQLFTAWVHSCLCYDEAYAWDMLSEVRKNNWNHMAMLINQQLQTAKV